MDGVFGGSKRVKKGVKTGVFGENPVFGFLGPPPIGWEGKIEVVWFFWGPKTPSPAHYILKTPSTALMKLKKEFAEVDLVWGKA